MQASEDTQGALISECFSMDGKPKSFCFFSETKPYLSTLQSISPTTILEMVLELFDRKTLTFNLNTLKPIPVYLKQGRDKLSVTIISSCLQRCLFLCFLNQERIGGWGWGEVQENQQHENSQKERKPSQNQGDKAVKTDFEEPWLHQSSSCPLRGVLRKLMHGKDQSHLY